MPDSLQSLAALAGHQPLPGFPEPEMAISHRRPVYTDPNTWGRRDLDQSEKGLGFLGPLVMPDGGVMSEYSSEATIDGRRVEYPLVVPTLTAAEVKYLLTKPAMVSLPRGIQEKALAFARRRVAAGLSPFAEPHETRTDLHPQFPRAIVVPPDQRGVMVGEQYLERARFPPVAVAHPSLVNLTDLARPPEPR